MKKFKALFPFTHSMGNVPPVIVSDGTMQTKEEEALWHYNKSREHDGLEPLDELPEGTVFQELH